MSVAREFATQGKKIIAIGRNYAAHIAELNNTTPTEPFYFLKPTTCYVVNDGPVECPRGIDLHHENFIPKEEIKDPHDLVLWYNVNGEERQRGTTGLMLWRIEALIEFVSGIITLEEGDIILTGTPEGTRQQSVRRVLVNPPLFILLIATLGFGYAIGFHTHRGSNRQVQGSQASKAKLESLYGLNDARGRTWLEHVDSLNPDNPPLEDCATKEFFLMSSSDTSQEAHGLGSAVHLIGWALRNAIDAGAILAWATDPLGSIFTNEDCLADGIRSIDCIFEPLTSCPRSSFGNRTRIIQTEHQPIGVPGDSNSIPKVFEDALSANTPKMVTNTKYWWRAQSAAYILRLSPNSLERVWESRANNKGSEMALHPLSSYVLQASEIVSLNPNAFSRAIFISSEDPTVFEEARDISDLATFRTGSEVDWTFYASSINRANGGPAGQLNLFHDREATTLSWMAELFIAMECDAFVGTRGSNWNRIIDELRVRGLS
ncbi:hypothetical protein RQP46_009188 [Phenoliferia psychrophenolica]